MELNDNKAGMAGLDKEKINSVILEASKGSLFYEHELKRKARLTRQINSLKLRLKSLTTQQISAAESEMDRYAKMLEEQRNLSRVIMHLDMDAFYAAVEMRDDRKLRNVPMAVGSFSMLCTSNYAARKFGVRAAMPGFIGKKLCPDLVIVPCNFRKYQAVSDQITEILAQYDPEPCKMSLDEAYLDLTDFMAARSSVTDPVIVQRVRYTGLCSCRLPYVCMPQCLLNPDSEVQLEQCDQCNCCRVKVVDTVEFRHSIEDVANEIRFRILQATGLTSSAGIAPNTMLAKICSDINKPNGQFVLESRRDVIMDFMKDMKIRKVPGIGAVTESMLRELGIVTCKDLFKKRGVLASLFSSCAAEHFLRVSLGISGVMSVNKSADYERKSMSVERTFKETSDADALKSICQRLCQQLAKDAKEERIVGRCITVKLKTIGFDVKTRAFSSQQYTNDADAFFTAASRLLQAEIDSAPDGVLKLRLMGVRLSMLCSEKDAHKRNKQKIDSFVISSKDEPVEDHAEQASSKLIESEPSTSGMADCKHHGDESSSFDAETAHELLSDDTISEPIRCPVCDRWLPKMSLNAFNQHVDLCLNRGMIGEILREQQAAAPSPTGLPNVKVSPVAKRRRRQSKTDSKTKSILLYLKRDDGTQLRSDDA